MNTQNIPVSDTVEQVLALLGNLSHTEKMIVARKIESEIIDLKLTEIDWITKELNLVFQQSH